jgi:NAD(P)-dependent dehydrogenase (short-subunit alcohol dehydrogenase family)
VRLHDQLATLASAHVEKVRLRRDQTRRREHRDRDPQRLDARDHQRDRDERDEPEPVLAVPLPIEHRDLGLEAPDLRAQQRGSLIGVRHLARIPRGATKALDARARRLHVGSMRVVVTGANRGIGLAIATKLAARGDEVHGTARSPKDATELAALRGVAVHALDVRDDASVVALARSLGPGGVDVLVNNAGIASGWESLSSFDPKLALDVYDTNAVGPVRVARALLPQLRAAKGKVFHVSSGMGSIGDNHMGGAYGYRMAKAAMNMAGRTLAIELAKDGVASIVVEPGWVKTDMGGGGATITPETSASQLIALFDRLGMESTGKFFRRSGEVFPW